QARLARRGVALTAVLAAAALSPKLGAVPAPLFKAVVGAALLAAAGQAAAVPAHVLALAEGVTPAMFTSKGKLAALLLVAAGLVAAGVGAASHSSGAAAPPAAPAKAEPRPAEAPKKAKAPVGEKKEADAVTVTGTVLGPDGKPLAGAKLAVWSRGPTKKELSVRATTKADGSFSVTTSAAEALWEGVLVATAPRHGPDWVRLDTVAPGKKVELRLPKDDLPITGRVLDLEGRPVAGVRVDVILLGKMPDGGDLKSWVDDILAQRKEGILINHRGLQAVLASALGWKPVT